MAGRRLAKGAVAAAALLTLGTVAACGGGDGDTEGTAPATPPTATGAESPTASPTDTKFQAKINRVTAEDLPHSWEEGCPVPPSDLRMIEMTYWGFDDRPHTGGRLVVNENAAEDLVSVFRKLYDMRFPIKRMEPVDKYKGSDFDSIEANNTSAFNCRPATGSGSWSQHAYGLAVDINPCQNPYVSADGSVAHPDCVKYKDRDLEEPGMIHRADDVVDAFEEIGWGWGGTWTGVKDYQHFSSNGR